MYIDILVLNYTQKNNDLLSFNPLLGLPLGAYITRELDIKLKSPT